MLTSHLQQITHMRVEFHRFPSFLSLSFSSSPLPFVNNVDDDIALHGGIERRHQSTGISLLSSLMVNYCTGSDGVQMVYRETG